MTGRRMSFQARADDGEGLVILVVVVPGFAGCKVEDVGARRRRECES